MAKQSQNKELQNAIFKLLKKYKPDDILHEMSVLFEEFSVGSTTEPEVEFWLKCSRACGNLSSGTEKWAWEMVEELREEEEIEEEGD